MFNLLQWRWRWRIWITSTIHWLNSGRPCECVVVVVVNNIIICGTAGVVGCVEETIATTVIATITTYISGWWRLCQWKWWRYRWFLLIIIYIVDCWVAVVACYRIVVICRSIATVIVNRLWIGYNPIAVVRRWRWWWCNWWLFLLLYLLLLLLLICNWRELKWWHLSCC